MPKHVRCFTDRKSVSMGAQWRGPPQPPANRKTKKREYSTAISNADQAHRLSTKDSRGVRTYKSSARQRATFHSELVSGGRQKHFPPRRSRQLLGDALTVMRAGDTFLFLCHTRGHLPSYTDEDRPAARRRRAERNFPPRTCSSPPQCTDTGASLRKGGRDGREGRRERGGRGRSTAT